MTNEELFLFDLQGFLLLEDVMSADLVAAANEAVDRHAHLIQNRKAGLAHTSRRLFGPKGKGGFVQNPLSFESPWCEPFRQMLAHSRLVDIFNEILGAGFRLDHGPALLEMDRGVEGHWLHGGMTFDPSRYHRYEHGRLYCGLCVASWQLTEIRDGDGGFMCIPGSHKLNYRGPDRVLSAEDDRGLIKHLSMGPGSLDPPDNGRATKVVYPDDPSNVYHGYIRDHLVMRIYNAGTGAPHVHHLHAHQWLRSPNSDSSQYLDSELIIPGSAFSLDMVYNGSGNRNQTVGDSIFHCHFYPHFAKGMWALWRVHDVFEEGTLLDPETGAVEVSQPGSIDQKLAWVRALPDGEIQTGTPIPAIVPLPTIGMAPIPAKVRVTAIPPITDPPGANWAELKKWVNVKDSEGRMIQVRKEYLYKRDSSGAVVRDENGDPVEEKDASGQPREIKDIKGMPIYNNPGFPFFVPGVAGHRPPHPPMAMAWEETAPGVPDLQRGQKKYLDGGLPRHQVLGGQIVREFHTNWDFTKDFIRYKDDDHLHQTEDNAVDGALVAYSLPEDGTPIEKGAMKAHSTRSHQTVQPDGSAGSFILNGLPPINGAPFADPGVDDNGNSARDLRRYKAAAIQKDVVINKLGWHYPQERFITLWQDVKPTFDEKRPPEPFFFRANGGETVDFWHTNLIPDYYELDDFQVRTPTDIIGQHIHLVKFDVTSSDGAENGFNYEDGGFSPDEVRGRIFAITRPWAAGSYKKLPLEKQSARKYDLFAFNEAAGAIDWSKWARTEPLKPIPWDGGYLQLQMTQGQSKPKPVESPPDTYLEPPPGQNWDGAMTTIMRFSTDPLLNNQGQDRTVRTVFTHDHFGASTHQQAGLYGGLLVEPANSTWLDPVTGGPYYDTVTRSDGGPTGWEAIIQTPNRAESYREFALELQDLQLAYGNHSRGKSGPIWDPEILDNPTGNPKLFQIPSADFRDGLIDVTSNMFRDFRENGIALSPQTIVKQIPGTDQWSVIDRINYAYGPAGSEPAFCIAKVKSEKDEFYNVFTPHLTTWIDWKNAINGNIKQAGGNPQLVSQGNGTYSFNYRNEPLTNSWSGSPITVPKNDKGRVENSAADFAYSFASIQRDSPWNATKPPESPVTGRVPPPLFNRPKDPANVNGPWWDPVGFTEGGNEVNDGKVSSYDPYTPLLRAYQNDRVQIRVLAGAHTATHSFTAHGIKWLFEPSSTNSGYRDAQGLGISEHFELIFRLPPATTPHQGPDLKGQYSFADYLYVPSSDSKALPLGMWGIMRSYDPVVQADKSNMQFESLHQLPDAANPRPNPENAEKKPICFKYPEVPDVAFTITAQPAPIIYNDGRYNGAGPIQNSGGVVFSVDRVQVKKKGDTPQDDKLEEVQGAKTNPGDPLVLRVNAGNWVKVTLRNKVPIGSPISSTVGLHPQLLAYDINTSDGANVGFNAVQTVNGASAGGADQRDYWWYAGDLLTDKSGNLKTDESTKVPLGCPRELGAVNLLPPDPLNQHQNGLVGALIVEPEISVWAGPDYVSVCAKIFKDCKDRIEGKKALFKEFVLIEQNDLTASYFPKSAPSPSPTPNPLKVNFALNNKSEDLGYRSLANPSPTAAFELFSDKFVPGKPQTPVFEANASEHVRFRVLLPGGSNQNPMFEIHGHSWQEEPYVNDSLVLGDNVKSQVLGAQIVVANQALNILIDSAGGPRGIPGDYLFYNYLQTNPGRSGAWGILRVK